METNTMRPPAYQALQDAIVEKSGRLLNMGGPERMRYEPMLARWDHEFAQLISLYHDEDREMAFMQERVRVLDRLLAERQTAWQAHRAEAEHNSSVDREAEDGYRRQALARIDPLIVQARANTTTQLQEAQAARDAAQVALDDDRGSWEKRMALEDAQGAVAGALAAADTAERAYAAAWHVACKQVDQDAIAASAADSAAERQMIESAEEIHAARCRMREQQQRQRAQAWQRGV